MILSRSSQYGLELILYLVSHPTEKYIPLKEIARKNNLSFYFLSKITQALVQNGILRTYRGPRGGVKLAVSSKELTLFDVINAIDGNALFNKCILRLQTCDESNPCPIHPLCAVLRKDIQNIFMNTTMDKIKEGDLPVLSDLSVL